MITVIWLLPILFMLHDFEEIIMVGAWKNRNRKIGKKENGSRKDLLSTRHPYHEFKSTASFSIAVEIEFLLLSIVALTAVLFDSYYVWFAFMFAVTFHYLIHVKICFGFGGYVPGVVTGVVFFPASVFLLVFVVREMGFTVFAVVTSCVSGVLGVVFIIWFLHSCMERFEGWIERFLEAVS